MAAPDTHREKRTFWVWDGYSDDGPRQEVGYATNADGYWWFPDVGQPGWGTSMPVGSGAFETRDACLAFHYDKAERGLVFARERLDKIVGMLGVASDG